MVVDLGGGNDGLSTLVPYQSGRYRDLRPTVGLDGDAVIDWGDGWGLNEKLKGLDEAGVAVLHGVGTATPSLSHFEMLDRWWRGVPSGSSAPAATGDHTGFLGRVCDAIQGDEQFTGVSLGFGEAPGLVSASAGTATVPSLGAAVFTDQRRMGPQIRRAIDGFSQGPAGGPLAAAREGGQRMGWIIDLLREMPPAGAGYPDTPIGLQMAIVSRLVRADQGVRVIHVPMAGSDFDTHQNHLETSQMLLGRLGDALSAFSRDLRTLGLSDQVLVATMSEFGRRPQEHDGGTDHGAASCAMLLGPVVRGAHGTPSSLTDLDQDDNLKATLSFEHYLATLAAFMQVEPARVLATSGGSGAPTPVAGVLRT